LLLLLAGFIPLCLLANGPITLSGVTLSLNAMLLCLVASVLGLQLLLISAVAKSLYDGTGRKRRRLLKLFSYTRTTLASAAIFLFGFFFVVDFVAAFIGQNYVMSDALTGLNHRAIFGTFLMTGSALVFVSMLLMHAVSLYVSPRATT